MAKMCPKCLRAVLTCNCQVETNKPRVAPGPTRPQRIDRLAAERARFEEWCVQRWGGDRGALVRGDGGEYKEGPVEFAWQSRLAALGLDP